MVSAGLPECGAEGLAGAVKLAADGIGGLVGDLGDGVVAEFLIGDQEEEDAVFLGEFVEGLLDALAKFGHLDIAKGAFGGAGGVLDDGVIGLRMDVPCVPAGPEVRAMIEGDAIEPGADVGIASEIPQISPGLEEDVVGGVLRQRWVPEKTQSEVEHLLAVRFVQGSEFGRQGVHRRGRRRNRRAVRRQFHQVGAGLHADWTRLSRICHGRILGSTWAGIALLAGRVSHQACPDAWLLLLPACCC